MGRSDNRTALTDAVARFQAEIQRLAFAAVRAIIKQELERRPAKPEPVRQRKRQPAQHVGRKLARQPDGELDLALAQGPERQLELPLARQAEPDAARQAGPTAETQPERQPAGVPEPSDAAAVPAAVTPEQSPTSPPGRRKRVPWTRETITSELANWMLSGTAIDAQFMTRHGPPGLVAAIRRVFGRFEAALNVAALHVSKLYPDGPPGRDAGPGRPQRGSRGPARGR
jgi:hypothetical protein